MKHVPASEEVQEHAREVALTKTVQRLGRRVWLLVHRDGNLAAELAVEVYEEMISVRCCRCSSCRGRVYAWRNDDDHDFWVLDDEPG